MATALRSRRTRVSSRCPPDDAPCCRVHRALSCAVGTAPCSRRTCGSSVCPTNDTKCSAVLPTKPVLCQGDCAGGETLDGEPRGEEACVGPTPTRPDLAFWTVRSLDLDRLSPYHFRSPNLHRRLLSDDFMLR
ncbi:hypothetical protein BC826DRAFT_1077981 [Russula brevipes]|nr:hypothetical protein BC826DRAFT_1077981 [Russula brevipes]